MSKRIEALKDILHLYRNYFFDLDGVVWKGDQEVKGAIQTLHLLRQQHKNIYFITNSSLKNQAELKFKLALFGFEAQQKEIYPSAQITAFYLQHKYPKIKKIITVGTTVMANQFRKLGFDTKELQEIDKDKSIQQILETELLADREAIIMGYDRHLSYQKIIAISIYVQRGLVFIGTNPDKHTMIEGLKIPGNGSFISVIEQATGVSAEIAGKPNIFILDSLIQRDKLERKECLMIGDNLQTDIEFGMRAKIDTVCVLTGVSNEQMVLASNLPTYFCDFLA